MYLFGKIGYVIDKTLARASRSAAAKAKKVYKYKGPSLEEAVATSITTFEIARTATKNFISKKKPAPKENAEKEEVK